MAVHCNSAPLSCKPWRNRGPRPVSKLLPAHLSSLPQTPFRFHSDRLKLSTCRWDKGVSAVVYEESAVGSSSSGTDVFKLTYLELSDRPQLDCLLITQSLDDHFHLRTLKPLSEMSPNLRVIATPNAKPLLDPLFRNVTYLETGQESKVESSSGSKVRIQATAGPVLGPPWQRSENGYLVVSPQGQLTVYYEPHCIYNKDFLEKERADIVITPVIKQLLPSFTLVSGQEEAVHCANEEWRSRQQRFSL